MPIRAFDDTRLTRTDLKVLGAYCGCVDWKTGWGWPKAQNLAEQLGMTARTFSKYTTRLKAAGYLFRGRRHEHGGFWWWIDYSGRSRPPEGDSKSPPQEGRLLYSTSFGSGTTPSRLAETGGGRMSRFQTDLRATEGCSQLGTTMRSIGSLPPDPVEKKVPDNIDKPKRLNSLTLAHRFWTKALLVQTEYPDPATQKELTGAFARWHRQGVSYAAIRTAQDLFWQDFEDTGPPAGRVFVKWASKWIVPAQEIIYQEVELPAIQKDYRRRLDAWYDEMEAKLAEVDPTIRFEPGIAMETLTAAGVPFERWLG